MRVKWKTILMIAAIGFVVYALVFTSPRERGGSGDPVPDGESAAGPVLRLYAWENYWATDTEQARREVELELGKTYETGHLLHITQIHQGGDKYVTICDYNYDDDFFPYHCTFWRGYFAAAYDGRFRAMHSARHLNYLIYGESHDDIALYVGNEEETDGYVSAKDYAVLGAYCDSYSWRETKPGEIPGYELSVQYLSDTYAGIPQTMNSVRRKYVTVSVTVQALHDENPELVVAEAVVQIRHYKPWEGAELPELLEAGVPLKDTYYRQEITLIEYMQLENIAELLS